MNLLHFDEWKDTDAVETMIYFLDAVITEFISDLEVMRDSDEKENVMHLHIWNVLIILLKNIVH